MATGDVDMLKSLLAEARARIAELQADYDAYRASAIAAMDGARAVYERDLADARAKLGQAWEEGAREGYSLRRMKLASVLKQNPYALMVLAGAPAGEKAKP